MTILRFPGRPSDQVPSWQDRSDQPRPLPKLSAPDLDACGLTEINGVAVGQASSGAIAGALAVAEACRPLHGGAAHAVQCRDLLADEAESVITPLNELAIAASLKSS